MDDFPQDFLNWLEGLDDSLRGIAYTPTETLLYLEPAGRPPIIMSVDLPLSREVHLLSILDQNVDPVVNDMGRSDRRMP